MRRIATSQVMMCLLLGSLCLFQTVPVLAQDEPDQGTMDLIKSFVGDADRETRAVGLQFIREDMPGEAATKVFAELLPTLSPEAQVDMMDALADRGDKTARPAVVEILKSEQDAVRAAALKALGLLGAVEDVKLLAEKMSAGSDAEQSAAGESLARIGGEGVNPAIVELINGGAPSVRIALLSVLASRNAKESLPTVLESAKDANQGVRIAALEALRLLADESHTAMLVETLKAAATDVERAKAELALLVVCSRGREACAAAIATGIASAEPSSQVALLRALARAGGEKAFTQTVVCLEDDDEAVRDQAVRMLSLWPDRTAMGPLMATAKAKGSRLHGVLAIRGLVRLASPLGEEPADVKTLGEVLALAKQAQEKRLVLGALGGIPTPESLALTASALSDATVAADAGLAAVLIAETIEDGDKAAIENVMKQVAASVKDAKIRQRANDVVTGL